MFETRFREDRPLSDKLFEICLLVNQCHWVSDALEKSMATNITCRQAEINERAEGVSAVLGLLLDTAADKLFDLYDALREAPQATPPVLEESA
jgi:hypothetical protein